jgi:hypothetical protein
MGKDYFSTRSQNPETKAKIGKWFSIKLKDFLTALEIMNRVKIQLLNGRKYL